MEAKKIYTGYNPRPLQEKLHQSLKRFNVIVAHRRFGKSIFCINEIIDRALRNPHRNPQYAYIGVTYGAVKRVMWDYAKEFTAKIPGVVTHEGDLKIEIPRPQLNDKIKILFLGAENPASIRGIYLDGVCLDEVAEMSPEVWQQVVRPALSDRRGWAIFISTPKSQNFFYELYMAAQGQPDWFSVIYRASETKILPEEELRAARLTMDESAYLQEMECSFTAALVGAYYGKQMEDAKKEGRICSVPYDPAAPVYTSFDLGISDATSIWLFQTVGKEIHFFEYIEGSGNDLAEYVNQLKEKRITFTEHFLPHDAEARELQTGKSRIQFLREQRISGRLSIVPKHNLDDGIHAARMALSRCWFDAVKCKRGIEALGYYSRKWDSKTQTFSLKPAHNWSSHGADSFRYAIMGLREDRPELAANLPRIAESHYDMFNLSEG